MSLATLLTGKPIDPETAATLERRRLLVEEIAALNSTSGDGADEEREVTKQLRHAEAQLAAQQEEIEQARHAVKIIQSRRAKASHARSAAIDPLRAELLRTAPAAIDTAIANLEESIKTALAGAAQDVDSGTIRSNMPSADAHIIGARDGIRRIACLRSEALDERQLSTAIKKIVKTVPAFNPNMIETKR